MAAAAAAAAGGNPEEEEEEEEACPAAPDRTEPNRTSPPELRAMPPASDLGRALCVVTGASRGFGRAVARDLSRLVRPGSALVLVARSGPDLRAVQAELSQSQAGRTGLRVEAVEADVGKMESLEEIEKRSREVFNEEMERIIVINNAASLGDVSRYLKGFTDLAEVDAYLSLNVSAAMCLTARLLQTFKAQAALRRCVVNVSSICALQPFRSWSLYCTGKAARDMMFRVLAEEEPELRVLSYSPGPLDTEMQMEARTKTADPSIKKKFSSMFAQGQLVTCEASSAKLMKLLLEDKFPSGEHIDIFDV